MSLDQAPPPVEHAQPGNPTWLPLSVRNEGKPGFIKRFDNYDEVRARAKAFVGTDIGKLLAGDIITSLENLTAAEKDVLRTALSLVSPDALKDGSGGIVFAGNSFFALRTANHPATIKRVRRSLERKGFALRHTDGDHNEARFDIRPFLANLEKFLDRFLEAQRMRRDAFCINHQFVTVGDQMLPRGSSRFTHIQSPKTQQLDSVRSLQDAGPIDAEPASSGSADSHWDEDADAPRTHHQQHRHSGAADADGPIEPTSNGSGGNAESCSARRASVSAGSKSAPKSTREQPLPLLLRAYELSPRWREHVRIEDIRSLSYDALFAATWAMIRTHFIEPRRNHHMTWEWAVKRHHWRAIIMAVVSLEDPQVIKASGYFGGMVKKGAGYDLSMNLQWIVDHRAEQDRRLSAEDPGDMAPTPIGVSTERLPPNWSGFLADLRRRAGHARFVNCFAGLAFLDLSNGVLTLAADKPFAGLDIKLECSDQVLGAARSAGWRIHHVRLVVKS